MIDGLNSKTTYDPYTELEKWQSLLGSKYAKMMSDAEKVYDAWYYENRALPAIAESFLQEEDALHQFYGLTAREVSENA